LLASSFDFVFSFNLYIFFGFVIVVDSVRKILQVEIEEEEPKEARRIKICVHDKERG